MKRTLAIGHEDSGIVKFSFDNKWAPYPLYIEQDGMYIAELSKEDIFLLTTFIADCVE